MEGDYRRSAPLYQQAIAALGELEDLWAMPRALEGVAGLAVLDADYVRAARLFGAAAALREIGGTCEAPLWRVVHDRDVAELRAAIGDEVFAAAWAEGRAMSLERAIAYALASDAPAASSAVTRPPASQPAPLSPRERDVAALVARGLTNRQIADALVVSERAVDAHVRNILGKLGFAARSQIAAWAVEHGLLATPALE